MALMHSEAVEVRNMNIRDKPPAGAGGRECILGVRPI